MWRYMLTAIRHGQSFIGISSRNNATMDLWLKLMAGRHKSTTEREIAGSLFMCITRVQQ